jgi:hypothetical protein
VESRVRDRAGVERERWARDPVCPEVSCLSDVRLVTASAAKMA